MNGFMHFLPWPTPGPIGIYMASNFSVLSLLLIAIVLVLDFTIWFPFIKAYDKLKLDEEHEIELQKAAAATAGGGTATAASVEPVVSAEDFKTRDHTNVLVVCAGGGTSGILANSLNKYAKDNDIPLEATARAYGQDMDLIKDMDIVILAPQMDAMKDEMRKYTDQYGAVLVPTTGKQYIGLTRDGEGAMKLIFEKINENNEESKN